MTEEKTGAFQKYGIPVLSFIGGILVERYVLPWAEKKISEYAGLKNRSHAPSSKPSLDKNSPLHDVADLLGDAADSLRRYLRERDFRDQNK